ncbi:hypothetical protein WA026_000501 [Henosepilachna vigintioctopunctata]|uniref:Uncharacterized protein n=1 Tax=Henosepilachna vigintioctopunctata TaxID=420089 RepID=A0AAW1V549_9CUCU
MASMSFSPSRAVDLPSSHFSRSDSIRIAFVTSRKRNFRFRLTATSAKRFAMIAPPKGTALREMQEPLPCDDPRAARIPNEREKSRFGFSARGEKLVILSEKISDSKINTSKLKTINV